MPQSPSQNPADPFDGIKADHRANWLLAAVAPEDFGLLEPHLKLVDLSRGQVLYEASDVICYIYFPHESAISLVNVMEDGSVVEVALFGREGASGLYGTLAPRASFGRYMVQMPGTASRIAYEHLAEVRSARPKLQQLLTAYGEALMAQTFQIVSCNAVHRVDQRCCRWILSIHDRVGQDRLPLTHEFLAEMLGVQRSSVSVPPGPFRRRG
jgi:CRP-like cAMP-binding protein